MEISQMVPYSAKNLGKIGSSFWVFDPKSELDMSVGQGFDPQDRWLTPS